MKRLHAVVFLLLILPCGFVFSADLSVSLGPWTFFSDDVSIPSGSYSYVGMNLGLTDNFELAVLVVPQLTPSPVGHIYLGGGVAASLLGGRSDTYFNMMIDAGFLYGLNICDNAAGHSKNVYLRISPLVIGNSYTGYRDRIFTGGFLYNFDSRQFSIVWNVLMYDLFFIR